MAYVYILESTKNGKYYVGSAKDYKIRLRQHNSGSNAFTKSLRPWKLVFYQKYISINIAKKIESKLKKFKSRKILNKIIEEGIIKTGQ